jgi:antitoxin MazE
MNSTFQKWGNSLAVRIPADVAKKLGLEPGSTADIEAKDGTLVFDIGTSTRRKVPKISLDWLLETASPENAQTNWDDGPRGREII